jgi:16S rRNA (guanine527-N7)-methyltransferase
VLSEFLAPWFELSPAQWTALEAHFELLQRWNKVLNLTRIDRPEEAAVRHYGESLFLARHLPPGSLRIVDVGSGPGFPGLPVAVVRSECSVTLVESHQRKAVFLREASRSIKNLAVLPQRAEQVRERYDWLISRAVSYEDLSSCLALAPNLALLSGGEEPPESLGLVWQPPISLPWGNQRFLRISRQSPDSNQP